MLGQTTTHQLISYVCVFLLVLSAVWFWFDSVDCADRQGHPPKLDTFIRLFLLAYWRFTLDLPRIPSSHHQSPRVATSRMDVLKSERIELMPSLGHIFVYILHDCFFNAIFAVASWIGRSRMAWLPKSIKIHQATPIRSMRGGAGQTDSRPHGTSASVELSFVLRNGGFMWIDFLTCFSFLKNCMYVNSLFPFSMLRCLSNMLRQVCFQSSNTCICGFVLVSDIVIF